MSRAIFTSIAFALATASAAHAEATTVDVVASDPLIAKAASDWLAQHGYARTPTPLDAQRVATIHDCIVIDEPRCLQTVVDQNASSDVVIYIATDDSTGISLHWIVKRGASSKRNGACPSCTPDMVREQVLQHLAALAGPRVATATPAPPAPAVTAAAKPTERPRHLAIGLEVGEPSSVTAGWFAGKLAIVGGLGSGTREGVGISARAAVQLEVTRLSEAVPLRAGLGGRIYHHGYDLASIDELPDTHYGVFASLTAALQRGPLELYGELAPGIDVKRTRSCALASGPATICPHAQEAPVFVHLVVGARWFL